MNPLSNMMVLDFLEWLRFHVGNSENMQDRKLFDLIFERKFSPHLEKLAAQYLDQRRNIVQNLFYSFFQSPEFWHYIRDFESRFYKEKGHYRELMYGFFHYSKVDLVFEEYIERKRQFFPYRMDDISAGELLSGVRAFISRNTSSRDDRYISRNAFSEDDRFLNCVNKFLDFSISESLDFFEWLIYMKSKQTASEDMIPVDLETLVYEYCEQMKKDDKQREDIVKFIKGKSSFSSLKDILLFFPKCFFEKKRLFSDIYQRYTDSNIPYKCFILPLADDPNSFKNFIKKYWKDLHNLSGDYLDIYYSYADFKKSGYEIKNQIKSLPENFSNNLPCIVLWNKNLKDAESIDIMDLSDSEIVRLISSIVDLIKLNTSFPCIVKKSRKRVKEFHEEKRALMNITNHVEQNSGIVIGVMEDGKVEMNSNNKELASCMAEMKQAIEIVKASTEANEQQKQMLISIFSEAMEAIQSNSESKREMSREKFKCFIAGAGDMLNSTLQTVASLMTVANFFHL